MGEGFIMLHILMLTLDKTMVKVVLLSNICKFAL